MKLTPLQRRAERRGRDHNVVDMNLVSLIDIFTILIFFLLSNSGVELLTTSRAVKLPESTAVKLPNDTLVVIVNQTEIVVEGRRVAVVADFINNEDDLIAPLKAELDLLAGRQTIRRENEAKGRAITILGDKEIPYQLLRKIMVTCARANFSDVSFAVQMKGES